MGWFMLHAPTRPKTSWSINARRLLSASGFTLTEVIVAMVVFSVALAGLSSMQMTTIKLNAEAYITTQMATVAQEQMEALLALPFTDPVLGPGTTFCLLYPPEGIRPSTTPSAGLACSDASFPPPAVGHKVLWTVTADANATGIPRYINITVSRMAAGKGQTQRKTYTLAVAKGL